MPSIAISEPAGGWTPETGSKAGTSLRDVETRGNRLEGGVVLGWVEGGNDQDSRLWGSFGEWPELLGDHHDNHCIWRNGIANGQTENRKGGLNFRRLTTETEGWLKRLRLQRGGRQRAPRCLFGALRHCGPTIYPSPQWVPRQGTQASVAFLKAKDTHPPPTGSVPTGAWDPAGSPSPAPPPPFRGLT